MKTSAAWGWVGIIIIVVVIAGSGRVCSSGWGGDRVNGETVIETQDLTKVYGEQMAVNHLNLIKSTEGKYLAFLGPNGAGKTTTLAHVTGPQ